MPLCGHSIGHVNVYALRADDEILLIDCGWALPGCLDHLDALLQQIGAKLDNVSGVILTHVHADHCGLAGDIRRLSGASISMHASDAAQVSFRYEDQGLFIDETALWAHQAGAPTFAADAALEQLKDFRDRFSPMAHPDVLLEDKAEIVHGRFRLEVIHTPGHTPGHLCFHETTENLLLTGDTIMPHINYSATYRPFSCPDPLGNYKQSLNRLQRYDARAALPGHQEIFRNPAGRARQLLEHQTNRSAAILQQLTAEESTAWELAARHPRRRPWRELRVGAQLSALGEAMAHLVYLSKLGAIACDPTTQRWRRRDDLDTNDVLAKK